MMDSFVWNLKTVSLLHACVQRSSTALLIFGAFTSTHCCSLSCTKHPRHPDGTTDSCYRPSFFSPCKFLEMSIGPSGLESVGRGGYLGPSCFKCKVKNMSIKDNLCMINPPPPPSPQKQANGEGEKTSIVLEVYNLDIPLKMCLLRMHWGSKLLLLPPLLLLLLHWSRGVLCLFYWKTIPFTTTDFVNSARACGPV